MRRGTGTLALDADAVSSRGRAGIESPGLPMSMRLRNLERASWVACTCSTRGTRDTILFYVLATRRQYLIPKDSRRLSGEENGR